MADVGSLGQYKVVVTADYSQLQTNFKAMADFVTSTTKSMTDSVNQSMSSINATMLKQLQTTVDQLKKSFEGLGEAPKKAGDGFKSYTKQINEATKEMQKAYQEQERMQRELEAIRSRGSSTTVGHLTNNRDEMAMVQAIEQQKAKVAELTANVQRLRQEEERYKNVLNQSDIAAKQRAKDMKQAAKDEQTLMRQNSRILEGEIRSRIQGEEQVSRAQQANAVANTRRIQQLQTQYRVAYEEVNKYLQSHTKMSEAVFIRLQGRLTAIGNEIRSLGAMPPIANPLANVNYEQYISGFSRLGDVIKSVRHHLMWMASAAVIGAGFGIPMGVSKAIESFDALQTKIMQNMELANQYAGNTERLHSDMNKMGEAAKTMAQGFGISLNEVQEGMQIVTRRFKDADTAIYLTSIALQMSKLDMVDVKQSAKDLEAVMLQFGMGAKDAGKFLNDFSVICHVARISGTDMLMALERSGSAFKAMNMDARAAMAAIAAVSTVTGKSGATIGDSWKSILANMDFKKATAALEAYNIKLYEVGANGAKTMRSGTAVLSEILATYQKLDDEGRRKLATAVAGGRLILAA